MILLNNFKHPYIFNQFEFCRQSITEVLKKKGMVEIRTTKTQKAEMQRLAALLSAPLEKTQV